MKKVETISGVIRIDGGLPSRVDATPRIGRPSTALMSAMGQFRNDLVLIEGRGDPHIHPLNAECVVTGGFCLCVSQNATSDAIQSDTYAPFYSLLRYKPYRFLALMELDGRIRAFVNRGGVRTFKLDVTPDGTHPSLVRSARYAGLSEPYSEDYGPEAFHEIHRDFEEVSVVGSGDISSELLWDQGPQAVTKASELPPEVRGPIELAGLLRTDDPAMAASVWGDEYFEDGMEHDGVPGSVLVYRVSFPAGLLVEADSPAEGLLPADDDDESECDGWEPEPEPSPYLPVLLEDALPFRIPDLDWINRLLDPGRGDECIVGKPDSEVPGGVPRDVEVKWSAIVRGIAPEDVADGRVSVMIAIHPVHEYGEDYGYYW